MDDTEKSARTGAELGGHFCMTAAAKLKSPSPSDAVPLLQGNALSQENRVVVTNQS
jgi:hypothetical protein